MATYHYHYKPGEKEAKCLEYACLEDSELLYIWLQPDCLRCQSYDSLPLWCCECGTLRDQREPLYQEIKRRGLSVQGIKMIIQTSQNYVDVWNTYTMHEKEFSRFYVYEIFSHILACAATPYPTFIVEWKYPKDYPTRLKDEFTREVITLSERNTKAWLDDMVRQKASEGCYINGIIELKDVTIQPYQVPEDYREFIQGDSDKKPEWYE